MKTCLLTVLLICQVSQQLIKKKLLNKQCLPYDRNENNEYYLHNSTKYGNDNGPTFLVVLALCDTSQAYKHHLLMFI